MQVLQLARELTLLRVGTISVDGAKVDAAASKYRNVRYDHAGDLIEQLEADIAALLDKAEQADTAEREVGQQLPEGLARREKLKAAPVGLLLAVLLVGGSVASMLSLTGRIERGRQVSGSVLSVDNTNPEIVEVCCRLGEAWRGHHPGQFAFVTFDSREGAHPFTIAIKALGGYTRRLPQHTAAGIRTLVQCSGYGRFELNRADPRARQIWICRWHRNHPVPCLAGVSAKQTCRNGHRRSALLRA